MCPFVGKMKSKNASVGSNSASAAWTGSCQADEKRPASSSDSHFASRFIEVRQSQTFECFKVSFFCRMGGKKEVFLWKRARLFSKVSDIWRLPPCWRRSALWSEFSARTFSISAADCSALPLRTFPLFFRATALAPWWEGLWELPPIWSVICFPIRYIPPISSLPQAHSSSVLCRGFCSAFPWKIARWESFLSYLREWIRSWH